MKQTRLAPSIALTVMLMTGALNGGMTFTASTEVEGKNTGAQDMQIKGTIDGLKARIEYVDGAGEVMQKGSYLITKDGGETIYMVNPEEKTYMQWDMEQMLSMVGSLMEATKGLLKIEVKDSNVKKITDEKGPSMLGYDTRHYIFQTAYTLETSVFGMKNAAKTVRKDEMWVAPNLDAEGLKLWSKQNTFATGHEELDKLIKNQVMDVKGFPLKQVTTTTNTSDGQTETSVATMTVSNLRQARVPASSFEIPQDYEKVSLEMPEETEEPEQQEDEGDAAPAIKNLMKMFRRN